jgi:hypothetical protein
MTRPVGTEPPVIETDDLKSCVNRQQHSAVVVVGNGERGEERTNPASVKLTMAAASPGSSIIDYDTLIRGARNSYAEYLQKSHGLDKIE